MDDQTVKEFVKLSINNFILRDEYLLRKRIYERTICHRLALYIEEYFKNFDIDCEYNGNIDAKNGRKEIYLLQNKALEIGLIKANNENNDKLFHKLVYPDIIVHHRGENGPENNLLIIEVKKNKNSIKHEWDIEKLKRFTSADFGNKYQYSLGLFIEFDEKNLRNYDLYWYKNGEITDL